MTERNRCRKAAVFMYCGWQTASKKVLKGNHAEHVHANCECTFGIAFNEKGRQQYDRIYDPQKYADMYYGAD